MEHASNNGTNQDASDDDSCYPFSIGKGHDLLLRLCVLGIERCILENGEEVVDGL
jgi:hypothetical protein